jgi:hypothetical protein
MSAKIVKYILALLWLLCFSQFREGLIADIEPVNYLDQNINSMNLTSIDCASITYSGDYDHPNFDLFSTHLGAEFDLSRTRPLYFIAAPSDRDSENGSLLREKMVAACEDKYSTVAVPLESIQMVNWTMPNIKSKLKIQEGEKSFLSGMSQCGYTDSNCFLFCKKMPSLHGWGLEWRIASP